MKKFILVLSVLLLLSAVSFSQDKRNTKQILKSDPNFQFHGYIIKDGSLFVASWTYEGNERTVRKIYKYENSALRRLRLNDHEIDFYWESALPKNDKNNNRIDLGGGKFIELIKPTSFNSENRKFANTDYFLVLAEGDKQTILSKEYIAQMFENYVFFDAENNKFYFGGANIKKGTIGVYEYDINKKKFGDFAVETVGADNNIYEDPIKIPRLQYLLYRTEDGEFWIKSVK
jgi:hypothetical protein